MKVQFVRAQKHKMRNVYFQSKDNLCFFEELEHNPLHIMISAALHLFNSYFFQDSINPATYLTCYENDL